MTWKGWEDFVPPVSRGTAAKPAPAKRSKFGNVPVEVDGLRFDSKREAARYQMLKVRMAAGEIRRLVCQPRFDLACNGEQVAEYVADFEYEEAERDDRYPEIHCRKWIRVVEDAKGHRTDVYRLKRKWFTAQYGIQIRET